MLWDKLNLFIISSILEADAQKKKITTWDIAKSWNWEDKPLSESSRDKGVFYKTKNNLIKYRFKDMAKEGIMIMEKIDGISQATLIRERVRLAKRHKFPDTYSKAVMIKLFEDKWVIYQI